MRNEDPWIAPGTLSITRIRRHTGERFGDFYIRVGHIHLTTRGGQPQQRIPGDSCKICGDPNDHYGWPHSHNQDHLQRCGAPTHASEGSLWYNPVTMDTYVMNQGEWTWAYSGHIRT